MNVVEGLQAPSRPLNHHRTAAPHSQPATGRSSGRLGLVGLFSATLLIAACLLFGLQPMFTKRVLPVLGGAPAVWSVATVVFQGLLLAGYAYAHALVRWLPPRVAAFVHGAVLLAGFSALPVAVAAGFDAAPADGEVAWLVWLMLASIGLPFFALSATAPLLQAWFSRSGDGRAADPYFLYRASNAGSLVALLAYPLVVEPVLGLDAQARAWSVGYAALTVAVIACALAVLRSGAERRPVAAEAEAEAAIGARRRLAWIGLSAAPSGLLVAATAHIATDVASIPLMWVAPLALYLLSFMLAFRTTRSWPGRALAAAQVVGTLIALAALMLGHVPLALDLTVTLALLLVNALIAHRAVYALRPPAGRLTEFYLCTSFGGMLGGLFAAILAPALFSGIFEYPILLVAALACRPGLAPAGGRQALAREAGPALALIAGAALAAGAVAWLAEAAPWPAMLVIPLLIGLAAAWRSPLRAALVGAALCAASLALPAILASDGERLRSFFGVHRVVTTDDGRFRTLMHGTTLHGAMRVREDDGAPAPQRPEPTTYYAAGGPLADVLEVSRRASGAIPSVSVVGLGAGSLACHARAGEAWTFHEIDPVVIRIALDPARFRFLSECKPDARIVQGDARLTLAQRADTARILIVDAFSSDAIPMHLLTAEAIALDLAHLDAQGVLALHITNRHFDLTHILARVAADKGLTLLRRADPETEPLARRMRAKSVVVLLTRDPAVQREALGLGWSPVADDPSRRPWTDDYANAIEAMIDRARMEPFAAP